MKSVLLIVVMLSAVAMSSENNTLQLPPFERFQIESRIPGLHLSMLHLRARAESQQKRTPILFIHGASFPSALAFGFRMNGVSWMDVLSEQGFDTYALDFVGYGDSDRYPEMLEPADSHAPLGRATEVAFDIDRAVDFMCARSAARKIILIGHSWGATVCAYYATSHNDRIDKLVLFAPFVERKTDSFLSERPTRAYETLAPAERIRQFRMGTPDSGVVVLEDDVLLRWGNDWLGSDPLAMREKTDVVRFPAGWAADLFDCYHGRSYYIPGQIMVPTLLIRGEWDEDPSSEDAELLLKRLTHVPFKRYVVIDSGTHVMHLERSRFQLYRETCSFLIETGKN
jgi:pimeloyl-ACP methyl ester carboxylesterase